MDRGLGRSHLTIVAGLVALAAGLSCREVTKASNQTPTGTPYVSWTLDTLCPGCGVDVGNVWGGATVLLAADQSVHVLAVDPWAQRLRYHGCANVCDDPKHWVSGTADTAPGGSGFDAWSTAVLTRAGIAAVYTWCPNNTLACTGVRLAECPGACNFGSNWTAANLFVGVGTVADAGYWFGEGRSSPLAADSSGGLHLLLDGPSGALLYEYCAATCGSAASWQGVQLDSAAGQHPHSIAFDPASGVHVFYRTAGGLTHASCAGSCTSTGSWQSGVIESGATVHVSSVALGSDGRLHLAYVDDLASATYATCAAPCAAPGSWSSRRLLYAVDGDIAVSARDVAIAAARGSLFLAINGSAVAVARCDSNCLAGTWRWSPVDSATSGGHVALAVDSAGRARIASTADFPNILQYTQLLQ